MTFGEAMFGLLSASTPLSRLVRRQIYPSVAPQNVQPPYIVYSVIDDLPVNSLLGDTGGLHNARMQIDCYSRGYDEANAIADAIDAVLSTHVSPTLSSVRDTRRDLYEDEASLHRVSIDYSVWKG